jgi:hypothetical protein
MEMPNDTDVSDLSVKLRESLGRDCAIELLDSDREQIRSDCKLLTILPLPSPQILARIFETKGDVQPDYMRLDP